MQSEILLVQSGGLVVRVGIGTSCTYGYLLYLPIRLS